MKNLFISFIGLTFFFLTVNGQKVPSGNPKDFKVKTCLHSVSYMGIWRGQATLTVDQFLVKAKELGFEGGEFMKYEKWTGVKVKKSLRRNGQNYELNLKYE